MTYERYLYLKMRLTFLKGRSILYLDDVAYRVFDTERRLLVSEQAQHEHS